MIGNIAYIAGGTGSMTGAWYQITGQSLGVSLTLDRSTGLVVGTGMTINVGGALATPGLAVLLMTVDSMLAWWKYSASTYSMTTATAGSAGPILFTSGAKFRLEGYDVTRGDRTGNRPKISWASVASPGANSYIITQQGSSRQIVANVVVDGNSVVNVSGMSGGTTRNTFVDCIVQNCNQTGSIGYLGVLGTEFLRCKSVSNTTGFSGAATASECYASGGTTGYTNFTSVTKCVATAMATGFTTTQTAPIIERCTADSCTSIGFDASTGGGGIVNSCLFTNCSGGGAIGFKSSTQSVLLYPAFYNNATDISGTPQWKEGQITLSADPYVNQAGADFRPNSTTGGGASLRNAGIGVFGQTDNSDVGAVQSTAAGGMLVHPDMSGGMRG